MTERTKSRARSVDAILCLGGSALVLIGCLLPMWSKNGISVHAWESAYLPIGRWVLAATILMGLGAVLIPATRTSAQLPGWGGILGCVEACLILWQGYKLQAIGFGSVVILLGSLLLLAASYTRRRRRSDTGQTQGQ